MWNLCKQIGLNISDCTLISEEWSEDIVAAFSEDMVTKDVHLEVKQELFVLASRLEKLGAWRGFWEVMECFFQEKGQAGFKSPNILSLFHSVEVENSYIISIKWVQT